MARSFPDATGDQREVAAVGLVVVALRAVDEQSKHCLAAPVGRGCLGAARPCVQ